ncbi:MAG TPA: ATP-binding protein, partial [Anaerolineales bacterium]|nr:ATP-binding protein [Anaerolineales bacterium]
MQLLEREPQLRYLDDVLREVKQHGGRTALIYGEAGIGKTSLVENFLQTQMKSWRVLRGACDALFTPRPLGPFHDMALQTGGELLALLESGSDRNAIFAASLGELGKRPTILLVEDIHWADEATLDLLKYLSRRMQQTGTLLILTYRDDELGQDHPLRQLLGDLGSSPSLRRIPVSALSRDAVSEMARGTPIDPVELYRLTNG